ncbi:MAG: 1-(5-phosphoribosyl)-5-[(5-phosphoribosylamino)methylideneamino] imidazole-4-carboxamide isomerase [Candidatus Aenigmatarchaeota archaeon]
MLIIPAVDLWDGKVVRFKKGSPSECKVYSNDPLQIVKYWEKEKAELIYLVDLSSALGKKDNLEIIKEILKKSKIKIEVGGGIRNIKKAEKIVSFGAERIVIGTKSIEKKFLKKLLKILGQDKVAVSVDVIGNTVMVEGWKKSSSLFVLDFISYLIDNGIKWIIYTDIYRDGTLKGVSIRRLKQLSLFKDKDIRLIISGGVSFKEDLIKIKRNLPFIWGIILGKALYEGKIKFSEALKIVES